ncbi:ribonuclease H-like domain-containing protein [Tanacetum coccineum]
MHKKYCLVVTDDYSRFTWVFFLTTKDETSEILKNFIKEIENLVDWKVKIIRSDNGTEFKNKSTSEENSQDCIVMPIWKDTSYFDSSTKDVDNCEPKTVADAQKQVENGPNNENAEQERFEDDSSAKDVNAHGQHVNTASPDVNTGSLKLNVVRPSVNTASLNKHDSPEDMFTIGVSSILEATHIESFSDEDEPEVRYVGTSQVFPYTLNQQCIAKLYLIILGGRMLGELLQFKLQQVWILVDLPSGKRAIRTKWVFRNKKDERGIVIRNKARLVAHGHRQEEEVVKALYGLLQAPSACMCMCQISSYSKDITSLSSQENFRYLKGKPTLGLWYSRDSPFKLVAYTDSDYARATQDRKSTTKVYFTAAKLMLGSVNAVRHMLMLSVQVPAVEEGTDCLPSATIFEELARMGYEKPSQKLTFYKAFFSPQWKYFIHTITQCLSAKSTAWNEFSCSMASLIICLATNQKFNLSKYIFDAMVKHLDGGVKFLMYLRFLQVFINQQLGDMSTHKKIFVNPFHTKKVFANMKRAGKDFSGRITPLFATMMVQASEEVGEDSGHPTDSTQVPILDQPSTSSKTKKKQSSKKTQRQEAEVSQDETEHEEGSDFEKSKGCSWKGDSAFKGRGIQREIGKEEIVKTYRFDEIKAAKQRCNTAATTTTTTRPKAKGVVVQEPSGSEKKEGRGGRGREEGGKRETGKENDFRRKKCFDFIWEEVREKGKGRDKKKGGEEKRERGRKERGEWELDKKKKKRNIGKKEKKEGKEGKKDDGEKKTKKKIMERDRVYSWENTKAHDGGCMIVAERLSNLKREREELTDEEKGNLIYGILMEEKKETLFASTQEH